MSVFISVCFAASRIEISIIMPTSLKLKMELSMRKSIPVVAVLAASLVLGGCASKTLSGAAIGAAAGAVAGKSTGNHKNKRALIGAAIGALAGAAVGQYMDQQEQMFRQELQGSGIDI